ncbi:putative manganese transporter [Nocardioides sp. cx-169]|uniref:putative manganese transporter n=1 Tax=Nocardioides sp. cx-169 TaxID=2899080 RepID=UPI001E5D177A|nr:putative manganese transporter [Nocardioides sp. cx-169]MCD4532870.1 putative manganese transporter [Nocardioides sp. cx-169]
MAGTAVAVVAFVRGGCKLADDDDDWTAHPTSMTQVLHHGGHEIAFVTVWVAVAYLAWSLVTHLTGFDGSQLPLFGVAGVVVGALVGLIPGCAVQIVFAGIFLAGGMPLSTLVANTVSQDGDALLPLLALEHRSALLATVLTTVPALLDGAALLVLT